MAEGVRWKRETTFSSRPEARVTVGQPVGETLIRFEGIRPYYRRTNHWGETTVFLRGPDGSPVGTVVFVTRQLADEAMPAGRSYTIEYVDLGGDR